MEAAVIVLSIALAIVGVAALGSIPLLWWKVLQHDHKIDVLDDAAEATGKLLADAIGTAEAAERMKAKTP